MMEPKWCGGEIVWPELDHEAIDQEMCRLHEMQADILLSSMRLTPEDLAIHIIKTSDFEHRVDPQNTHTTCRMKRPSECGLDSLFRAEGNCVCPGCGKGYSAHRSCINSLIDPSMASSQFPEFYAQVLCNGDHVKL